MLGIKSNDMSEKPGHEWIGPAPWIESPLPGPNARALIARSQQVRGLRYTGGFPLVARRGLGSVIEDVDGNRLLDLAAGFAVGVTGYCHPKVATAIAAQAKALVHICGTDFLHPSMVELMERLGSLAPGSNAKRVHLTNSAHEAIEVMIELARRHTQKEGIIAFQGAGHDRILGTLGQTVDRLPYGHLDALESSGANGKLYLERAAAILVEAVQAESGHVDEQPTFLPRLRSLCDQHGILLVCDEMQTGLGRTGRLFAFEHFGVEPDVILTANSIASGMPLGAVIMRANLEGPLSSGIGRVCGGNPVCCAASLATLDLVESTYLANAQKLGLQLKRGLGKIAEARKVVTNVRGLGLICAVDIVNRRSGKGDPRARQNLLANCFERGLILLPCGKAGILFCPALCINEAQLDVGLRVFESGVAAVT